MKTAATEDIQKYQREWLLSRRREWLAGKRCCICFSDDRLRISYKDPATKIRPFDHNVWSATIERRNAELEKCEILCFACQKLKSNGEKSARQRAIPITHGIPQGYRELLQMFEVRQILSGSAKKIPPLK